MHTWPTLSMVGLSLVVAGGALTGGAGTDGVATGETRGHAVVVPNGGFSLHPRPAAMDEAFPFEGADAEEMAATERNCLTPRWGESEACATFALASKTSVEIALLDVKDPDGNDHTESVTFRLYDVKGQTSVTERTISVGSRFTYVNNTDGLLDLVVHAKNNTMTSKRNIRFTYEKK